MRVLDLFSGVGMFAYGMEQAGHEVIAFCEIEEWPRRVLDKRWPDVPKYTDVRELNRERLEADGVTGIEIITGGFPCQDLSVAGKQAGIHGERSGLFDEILRIACDLRAGQGFLPILILENVAALLTGAGGEWARYVFGRLAQVGYVFEWHVIPAGNPDGLSAGAPHRRERVWIVAYPSGEGLPQREVQRGSQAETGGPSTRQDSALGDRASNLSDTKCAGGEPERTPQPNLGLLANGITDRLARSRWLPEPGIGRVATGVPDRLQKLKALGNGLIWQIPYAIGCAINDREVN